MKKSTFLTVVLLMALALAASSCTLPAKVSAPPPITETQAPLSETQPPAADFSTPTSADVPAGDVTTPTTEAPSQSTQDAAGQDPTSIPPPTQEPGAAVTATSAPPTPSFTASRIQFQTGGVSSTVRGDLNSGETVHYVLQASSGQSMTVEVWSPNGDVYMAVSGMSDGRSLVEPSTRATSWTGALPATQDYHIAVTAGGGMTSYSVQVTIPPLATSTAGGQATVTPSAGRFDPNTSLGAPKFVDRMEFSSKPNWEDADGNLPDTNNIRINIQDNRFTVTGKNAGWSTWWFSWPVLQDFYQEMTVETMACSGKDAYGLIFRGPQRGAGKSYGYAVLFSCDGAFRVFRVDSADPYTEVSLVGWTASEHIQAGANQRNLIGVRAEGKDLVFYANGYKLAEVEDDNYKEGRYGVFVSPANTQNLTYRVVQIAYWLLD